MTRYAAYYAPAPDDPLWRAGCSWLGRDPAGGVPAERPGVPEEVTAAPRQYGFHATLKPPMRLRPGYGRDDVEAALRDVAASVPAFALPPLAVQAWHGFLCLRETTPSPALQALSDACVAGLDHLRAPPDDAELAQRRGDGLPAAQDANLRRWGYPQVFATWFFHMTLTRRLDAAELARWRPAAEAWFADALAQPRSVTDVCLFTQDPEGPFSLAARAPCDPSA